MSFSSGASALHHASPIGGAMAQPAKVIAPPEAGRAPTLTERLDDKLAELRARGLRIVRLEMSQAEMVTLFREAGGEEVIRLDPDPKSDRGWYGEFEVKASKNEFVWIFLEGEVAGEQSVHIVD